MSAIIRMYVELITAPESTWTIDRVPARWREQVREALANSGNV